MVEQAFMSCTVAAANASRGAKPNASPSSHSTRAMLCRFSSRTCAAVNTPGFSYQKLQRASTRSLNECIPIAAAQPIELLAEQTRERRADQAVDDRILEHAANVQINTVCSK